MVSQNKKKHIQGTTSEHTAQRGEKEKNYFSKNCGPFFLVQFFHFFRKGCCCSLDNSRTPPSLPDFRITEIEQSLPTWYSVLSGGLIFPSLRKRTLFVVGFLSSISHIPYPISASTIATPPSLCCIRKTSSSPFHFSQVFSVLSVFTQFSQFSNPISEMLQVPLFPLLPTCVSLRVPGPPPHFRRSCARIHRTEHRAQNTQRTSTFQCEMHRIQVHPFCAPTNFLSFLGPCELFQLVGTVLPLGYIRRNFQASERKKKLKIKKFCS